MESTVNKELDNKVAELSKQLEDIQEGRYPPPSGGYDVVVKVWARLLRTTLPVYSETIKSINRGSTALICATWALVVATIVLAAATIALVCVTKAANNPQKQLQMNRTQQTEPVAKETISRESTTGKHNGRNIAR